MQELFMELDLRRGSIKCNAIIKALQILTSAAVHEAETPSGNVRIHTNYEYQSHFIALHNNYQSWLVHWSHTQLTHTHRLKMLTLLALPFVLDEEAGRSKAADSTPALAPCCISVASIMTALLWRLSSKLATSTDWHDLSRCYFLRSTRAYVFIIPAQKLFACMKTCMLEHLPRIFGGWVLLQIYLTQRTVVFNHVGGLSK